MKLSEKDAEEYDQDKASSKRASDRFDGQFNAAAAKLGIDEKDISLIRIAFEDRVKQQLIHSESELLPHSEPKLPPAKLAPLPNYIPPRTEPVPRKL